MFFEHADVLFGVCKDLPRYFEHFSDDLLFTTFFVCSSSSKVLSLNLRNYPTSVPPGPQSTVAASLERAVSKVLTAATAPDLPNKADGNEPTAAKKAKHRSKIEEEA